MRSSSHARRGEGCCKRFHNYSGSSWGDCVANLTPDAGVAGFEVPCLAAELKSEIVREPLQSRLLAIAQPAWFAMVVAVCTATSPGNDGVRGLVGVESSVNMAD
jgi:hypothetical protein